MTIDTEKKAPPSKKAETLADRIFVIHEILRRDSDFLTARERNELAAIELESQEQFKEALIN